MKHKLAGLDPAVRAGAEHALAIADYYGIPVTVTSGYRSISAQRRLRRAWEQGRSELPANRPGESSHNFGLAWDSSVAAADLEDWNYIRQWVGFKTLSNDRVHAEVWDWRDYVR